MSNEDLSDLNPINDMKLVDPLMDSHGLNACWRPGNVLVAFASPGHPNFQNKRNTLKSNVDSPHFLHEVKWNTTMHNRVGRKLINESHLIFSAAQQINEDSDEEKDHKPQLLKLSRNYRSILRSCFLELRQSFEESEGTDEDAEVQMQLFNMMELIWSLCEILFIENLPDGVGVLQLLEWCKWHFTTADQLVRECMDEDSDVSPSSHPKYWDAVYALALQGRLEEVRNMLKLHPSSQTQSYDAFSSMDELLRKMPVYQHLQGQSLGEFEMKWRHWHDECVRRLKDGDFSSKPKLVLLCKILCGDEEAIADLPHLSGAWYQILVSYLLYKNPSISVYDLHYHSKMCIEMTGGFTRLGALDDIILAAFKFDISQVIREWSTNLSSWWLPAHLTDLFNSSGLLPPSASESGGDLREHLVVEYANSLSSEDTFWAVVATYLAHCGPHADHYLPLFVQRVPIASEKKATKVLRLCGKHELVDEARSICRQMARRALQFDRVGTALSWSIKAGDSSVAMFVADRMLTEYAKTGSFPNMDLVDHLGPTALMSDRLTFLAKYRDFHRMYAENDLKSASVLLLNLLVHGKSPPHFWLSLLMDCLPILEKDELYYDTEAVCGLLNRLNSLNRNEKAFSHLTEAEKENKEKKLEHLRLALTNYLARAIVS